MTSPKPNLDGVLPAEPKPPVAETQPAAPAPQPDKPAKSSGGHIAPPWYKRRWLYITIGGVLITALAGAVIYMKLTAKPVKPAATQAHTPKPTPSPTPTVYSPLTGLPVANQGEADRPVVGVMIENLYPDARPQSGLSAAGVVYEALAEGGITRFLGIFQEPLPPSFGPVRSLRPYYLDWGLEYNIPVAHAGGSQPALAEIGPLGMKNIDALVYSGSYFFRTSDRAAPHNLYTNADLLTQLLTKLGFATPPTFKPVPRKPDAPSKTAAPHPTIKINFSTSAYAVQYNFDPASDSYGRILGGTPHIDRNTGKQIFVKNVVVIFTPISYGTQPDGKEDVQYHLTGSGQGIVFMDGNAAAINWSKASDSAQTQLTDAAGQPVNLNRGNTWYEVVPTGTAVSY